MTDTSASLTVTLYCCLCDDKQEVEVALNPGWKHQYGEIEDERHGFCPKHAAVEAFTDNQCPGCVAGWGDCPLWEAFAYARKRSLTDADFTTLEHGRCPRRVNGTLMTNRTADGVTVEEMDLSTPNDEGGMALASAIRDYIERWPS